MDHAQSHSVVRKNIVVLILFMTDTALCNHENSYKGTDKIKYFGCINSLNVTAKK